MKIIQQLCGASWPNCLKVCITSFEPKTKFVDTGIYITIEMTVKDVELFVKFFINDCTWHTKLSSFQTLSKQMFDSLAKKKMAEFITENDFV
jgi:hypothetical protein